jgi:hypothetical protein
MLNYLLSLPRWAKLVSVAGVDKGAPPLLLQGKFDELNDTQAFSSSSPRRDHVGPRDASCQRAWQ